MNRFVPCDGEGKHASVRKKNFLNQNLTYTRPAELSLSKQFIVSNAKDTTKLDAKVNSPAKENTRPRTRNHWVFRITLQIIASATKGFNCDGSFSQSRMGAFLVTFNAITA